MRALILGGAATLAADEARARALFTPDVLIGTNHAGRDREGPLPHWVSFHCELFPRWIRERAAAGRPAAGQLWTGDRRILPAGVKAKCSKNWGGSTGLLAVTVALELGFEKIVLAGVPLTREDAHYDDPKPWRDAGNYRKGWISHLDDMGGRVRSMSGWTAELLGVPDEEWLHGPA